MGIGEGNGWNAKNKGENTRNGIGLREIWIEMQKMGGIKVGYKV